MFRLPKFDGNGLTQQAGASSEYREASQQAGASQASFRRGDTNQMERVAARRSIPAYGSGRVAPASERAGGGGGARPYPARRRRHTPPPPYASPRARATGARARAAPRRTPTSPAAALQHEPPRPPAHDLPAMPAEAEAAAGGGGRGNEREQLHLLTHTASRPGGRRAAAPAAVAAMGLRRAGGGGGSGGIWGKNLAGEGGERERARGGR
jgi:hypothetical protein